MTTEYDWHSEREREGEMLHQRLLDEGANPTGLMIAKGLGLAVGYIVRGVVFLVGLLILAVLFGWIG